MAGQMGAGAERPQTLGQTCRGTAVRLLTTNSRFGLLRRQKPMNFLSRIACHMITWRLVMVSMQLVLLPHGANAAEGVNAAAPASPKIKIVLVGDSTASVPPYAYTLNSAASIPGLSDISDRR